MVEYFLGHCVTNGPTHKHTQTRRTMTEAETRRMASNVIRNDNDERNNKQNIGRTVEYLSWPIKIEKYQICSVSKLKCMPFISTAVLCARAFVKNREIILRHYRGAV